MRSAVKLGAALFLAVCAFGQTPAGPQFEVASIKPIVSPMERRSKGLPPLTGDKIDPAQARLAAPLQNLIRRAYRLKYYQKLTGPDWMTTEWYEVVGKFPEGAGPEQLPEMLQALLAERLKLVIRKQSGEEPVYILTVGKDGSKLKEAPADVGAAAQFKPNQEGRRTIGVAHDADGWRSFSGLNGQIVFDANRIRMETLAAVISREAGLPVLDQTGLTGFYEVSMPIPGLWLGAAGRAVLSADHPDEASDPGGVNIFKSVEKLGLKLDKGKAVIEHLVVEHVEKAPAED